MTRRTRRPGRLPHGAAAHTTRTAVPLASLSPAQRRLVLALIEAGTGKPSPRTPPERPDEAAGAATP